MKCSIMGILNCTPDSFFADSRHQTAADIASRTEEMICEGADIIDVGACSTRPGSQPVGEEEEMRRLSVALGAVRSVSEDAVVSVDTFRPAVARMAVRDYGVQIINDVSEAEDREMFSMVGELGVAYVLMSVEPTMERIISRFRKEVDMLHDSGCKDIILDPGFGFGKDVITGNYEVLRRLPELREAFPEYELLAGMSRKRMAWMPLQTTPDTPAALHATTILNTMAVAAGATILRVHDVKQARSLIECSFPSA